VTRKLTRSQLRPLALRLYAEQGHVCALCGMAIDLTEKGGMVVDHDHDTGRVRGALHRSCNSGEGRVANAAGRWGAKSMQYSAIIPWLERLLVYLRKEPTDFIYPTHQTEDEKRVAANAKARRTRATRKAREVVRKSVVKKD
jgi:hypothetical protein